MRRGLCEVADGHAGEMQMVGRIARVEQPLGEPERLGMATVRQRRQDRPRLGERDEVGGAERQRDLLGAGGRALRRRRVAAEGRDHRDRRLGGGEPDRLAELGRQPAGLLGGGDRDVPVGQANGQDRLRRQQAGQGTEAPFCPGAVDRGGAERQAVVEGAGDDSGRGQVPRGLRTRHAAVRGVAQAVEDLRRVGVRIGVGMDRDQPRIRGGGRSRAIGGIHDQLPGVRVRARPPRARGGDPEQVVVQLAIARRAGLLGGGDQTGHP